MAFYLLHNFTICNGNIMFICLKFIYLEHFKNNGNLKCLHSLLLSEANSLRSRSFMGKLTKVDSLLVLMRASEKRFRSEQVKRLRRRDSAHC